MKKTFIVMTFLFVLISVSIPIIMVNFKDSELLKPVQSIIEYMTGEADATMKDIIGYGVIELWVHNVIAASFCIVCGIIPYFYIGVFVMLMNAFALGYQVGVTELMMHYDLTKLWFISVAPHGILEYLIHIVAYTFAVVFCRASTHWWHYRDNEREARYLHLMAFRFMIYIIIPGLFICSLLEYYVTPFLIWKFLLH